MNTKKNNIITHKNRWLWISIILILIATLTPGTQKIEIDVGPLDKVVHFGIFLFLSINICFKYLNHKKLTDMMLWATFFALLTEIAQQYIPGRDMDIYDGLADILGIISGYYGYKAFHPQIDKVLS